MELNRDQIKYFAMVVMAIDHITAIFMTEGGYLYEILINIGYFTAISMCYFLVEGYDYTRSKKKYAERLLLFALISEIPFCLAMTSGQIISYVELNMMFTLFLCFMMIWALDTLKNPVLKVIIVLAIIFLSILCDWAIWAPVMTLLFIWSKGNKKRLKLSFALITITYGVLNYLFLLKDHNTTTYSFIVALISMSGMTLAGICITLFYNHKRSEKHRTFSKYFFYLFYPLHLLVLGILRIAFNL